MWEHGSIAFCFLFLVLKYMHSLHKNHVAEWIIRRSFLFTSEITGTKQIFTNFGILGRY
jgi:hypothetical protein